MYWQYPTDNVYDHERLLFILKQKIQPWSNAPLKGGPTDIIKPHYANNKTSCKGIFALYHEL